MQLRRRAEIHAALGDPARLAIVDHLVVSDRSPGELSRLLGIAPSLLAFHLDTLEDAGLVVRHTSSGDRRRKYVQLVPGVLELVAAPASPPVTTAPSVAVVFVCTRNSARSQLAAALWRHERGRTATSAGTHPADRVHPGAVAAARRAGLDLGDARPTPLGTPPADRLVITVCDQAYEELGGTTWHWSVSDPVETATDDAFDHTVDLLRARIRSFPHLETT